MNGVLGRFRKRNIQTNFYQFILVIFVVAVSALLGFIKYLKGLIQHKSTNFKFELAQGLASGLEFKMAAEILKTVLVHNLDELLMLGAVILLRALLSLLIHMEMKQSHNWSNRILFQKNLLNMCFTRFICGYI